MKRTGQLNLFTDTLPVFNPLACDGGRCEICQQRAWTYYLSRYGPEGEKRRNLFVCPVCYPAALVEAEQVGRVDVFDSG